MNSSEPGEIITFYSYKGGTGRSMALANVACLLAQRVAGEGGVLMVDWDLEAPGLHRYFASRFHRSLGEPPASGQKLQQHPGLIDLFERLYTVVMKLPRIADEPTLEIQEAIYREVDPRSYILETDVPNVSILKAGCFDEHYARRVNTFQWEPMHQHAPWVVPLLVDWFSSRYRYTLIDSRTGITDTSGICTMLMPDKLITVFTPNQQSLDGVLEVAERATNYRRTSQDLRPLSVFPLPSRIEMSEPSELARWRKDKAYGYQPRFEALFQKVLGLKACNLEQYLNEVQIQHASTYAYGEKVAVLTEEADNRISLRRAYVAFAERLATLDEPWEVPAPPGATTMTGALPAGVAESVYARLNPGEQEAAKRAFLQLVRVSSDSTRPVGREVALKHLAGDERAVLDRFASLRIVKVSGDLVCVADEELITAWPRLNEWISSEIDFLHWRDGLDSALANWEKYKRESSALLRGQPQSEARHRLALHPELLNAAEREFIEASGRGVSRSMALAWVAGVVLLAVAVGGVFAYRYFRQSQVEKLIAQAVLNGAEPKSLLQSILSATEALKANPASNDAAKILRDDLAILPDAAGTFSNASRVVFSPDNSHFAVSYANGSVRVDDFQGGGPSMTRQGRVNTMAFSADGKWLAIGRADNTRQLIGIDSGYQNSINFVGAVTAVAFSPAGSAETYIATGTSAGRISLSMLPDSNTKQISMRGPIGALVFSPSGMGLAAAGGDKTVQLFGTATGRSFGILEHPAAPQLLAYRADGKFLATAAADGLTRIWLAERDSSVVGVAAGGGDILGLYFASNGQTLVLASSDGSLRTLKVPLAEPLAQVRLANDVSSCAYWSRGDLMAAGSSDGSARIVNVQQAPAILWGVAHKQAVVSLGFSPDGKHWATTSKDGQAMIWKLDPANKTRYSKLRGEALVRAACLKVKGISPEDPDYKRVCP